MIHHYSKNVFKQIAGILRYNYGAILVFIFIGSCAFVASKIFMIEEVILPVVPVTILGGGLAIFLGFRNNTAYDRWWEARKIWGAIVNSSRHFGTQVMTYLSLKHGTSELTETKLMELQKAMIYRQIAWINALRMSLRGHQDWHLIKDLLSEEEFSELLTAPNKATFLNHLQGRDLRNALDLGAIEDFRHLGMMQSIRDFFDHQGKCERIKKTVFPFYYTYFTQVFLWLFIVLLPFALIDKMNYMTVPLSVAISFAFYILDKTGNITEDPFENRAADVPLSAICRTIEIDLRHQLGERDLPEPLEPELTKYGAEYSR